MKKCVLFGLMLLIGWNFAFAQNRLLPKNADPAPTPGFSMVVIANKIKGDSVLIYINGVQKGHLLAGETEKYLVPNGKKREIKAVQLRWNSRKSTWDEKDDDSRTFDCQAELIAMEVTSDPDLDIVGRSPLAYGPSPAEEAAKRLVTASAPPPASTPPAAANRVNVAQSSIETALYRAADTIMGKLPRASRVAILSVASRDLESAEFVVDELTYVIVNQGNFKVVDRKSLEAVRSEQDFQLSGDVDDDSAVSIGKLLGANIVITGSITGAGSTRRLRFKALNVTTAEIVAMASESF